MLQRTNDVMTAGITNIPLTKPAFLYFVCDVNDKERLEQIYNVFTLSRTPYHREDNIYTQKAYITSDYEINYEFLKAIWRNFKLLRPKLKSAWRYLFWEIDTQNPKAKEEVEAMYAYLKLPLYVHKTMRGYHFLSVKPIEEPTWKYAIDILRPTNPDYPPTTLRIQANKYIGELDAFKDGYIINDHPLKKHYDTFKLREYIESFNLVQLQQQYIIVFYPFPDQAKLDSMTFTERVNFQLQQIEDSE